MKKLLQAWEKASGGTRTAIMGGMFFGALIIAILAVMGVLIYQDSKLSTEDVVVTNVTDTAVTVTWTSDKKYVGRVVYQEGDVSWPAIFAQSGKSFAFDDRDVELNQDDKYVQREDGFVKRHTHHVTIRDLKPETEYSFRVAGAINGKDAEVTKFKTEALIEDITTPDPGYGKVEGVEAKDSFIIFYTRQVESDEDVVAQYSVPMAENGTYSIDLKHFGSDVDASKVSASIVAKDVRIAHNFTKIDTKPFETIVVKENDDERGMIRGLISEISAQAATITPVSGAGSGPNVRLRDQPNTTGAILASMPQGSSVTVVAQFVASGQIISGTCNSGWHQITYGGQTGYACADFVTIGGTVTTPTTGGTGTPPTTGGTGTPPTTGGTGAPTTTGNGVIGGSNANVRPGPSTTSGASVGRVNAGASVTVECSETSADPSYPNAWYKISSPAGYVYSGLFSVQPAVGACGTTTTSGGTQPTPQALTTRYITINGICVEGKIEDVASIRTSAGALGMTTASCINPPGVLDSAALAAFQSTNVSNPAMQLFKTVDQASRYSAGAAVTAGVGLRCGDVVAPNVGEAIPLPAGGATPSHAQARACALDTGGGTSSLAYYCEDLTDAYLPQLSGNTINCRVQNVVVPINAGIGSFAVSKFNTGTPGSCVPETGTATLTTYPNCTQDGECRISAQYPGGPTYGTGLYREPDGTVDQCCRAHPANNAANLPVGCDPQRYLIANTGGTAVLAMSYQEVNPVNGQKGPCVAIAGSTDPLYTGLPAQAITDCNGSTTGSGVKCFNDGRRDFFRESSFGSVGNCTLGNPTTAPSSRKVYSRKRLTDTDGSTCQIVPAASASSVPVNCSSSGEGSVLTCGASGTYAYFRELNGASAPAACQASAGSQLLNDTLVKPANASTPNSREAVLGANSDGFSANESGSYAFFKDGELVAVKDIIVGGGNVKIQLFNDANGNKIKDAGEEYIEGEALAEYSLKRESSAIEFNLSSGWNLIHIPLVNAEVTKASELLRKWSDQGAEVQHVTKFDNGSFEQFTRREGGTEFSGDFTIFPGTGLFVYNAGGNKTVTFNGNEPAQSVPVTFNQGWNLVGIFAPDTDYTSESLLTKLAEKGVKADTVSQYENGLYQSVIKEEDTIFGNNFNVVDKRGYFIRVSEGGGTKFTP